MAADDGTDDCSRRSTDVLSQLTDRCAILNQINKSHLSQDWWSFSCSLTTQFRSSDRILSPTQNLPFVQLLKKARCCRLRIGPIRPVVKHNILRRHTLVC